MAWKWLKDHHPKVALHPHKSDYCNTCKGVKEEISCYSTTLKRLRQSGSTSGQELRSVQLEVETSEQTLISHKEEASAGRDYYNTTVLTCKENWAKIMQLYQALLIQPLTQWHNLPMHSICLHWSFLLTTREVNSFHNGATQLNNQALHII